jgi:type VII secretion integral membrane protein EccD
MTAASTGQAHITIHSPNRRVDLAVPDGVPVAELLAEILEHAGIGLPDAGERHGGWLLRRADGAPLTYDDPLVNQGVRDGTVLHLVPARDEWPEPGYDDLAEAIADGARQTGPAWSPAATRVTSLVGAAAAATLAFLGTLRLGSASVALLIGLALVFLGTCTARLLKAPLTGAVLAGLGLPFAFAGGAFSTLGPPAGCLALLVASLLGVTGVASWHRIFTAGATVSLLAGAGLAADLATTRTGATAALLAAVVVGLAAVPLLAIRLGRLPLPATGPAGVDGAVDREHVFAAVAHADELLTGLLAGCAVTAAGASIVLARTDDVSARVLVAVAGLAFLVRARLFPAVRHRVPLLAAGVTGLGSAALAAGQALPVAVAGTALAVVVALAGLRYAGRLPSPYLTRGADLLDVLSVVAVVPLAGLVLGLFGLALRLS